MSAFKRVEDYVLEESHRGRDAAIDPEHRITVGDLIDVLRATTKQPGAPMAERHSTSDLPDRALTRLVIDGVALDPRRIMASSFHVDHKRGTATMTVAFDSIEYALGGNVMAIGRGRRGDSQGHSTECVAAVEDLASTLSEVYEPAGLLFWSSSPNRVIGGLTPAEVIRMGDTASIRTLALYVGALAHGGRRDKTQGQVIDPRVECPADPPNRHPKCPQSEFPCGHHSQHTWGTPTDPRCTFCGGDS